jgi:hypothetical protein
MPAADPHQPAVIEPPGHALGLIRLDRQMLGDGVDRHVPLDAVARKVADRP